MGSPDPSSGPSTERQCSSSGALKQLDNMTFNRCAAAMLGCVVVVVAVIVMVFIIRAMASDTNNNDTKVDGNDNNIKTTNSKEFSLVHIDSIQNLATGQKLTNIMVILGFLGILGFGCFYLKAKKRARRFLKDLERQEVMDKISAIETEMVARGFMKKSKAKKTRKAKKTLTKKTSKRKTRKGRSIEEPGSTEDSD